MIYSGCSKARLPDACHTWPSRRTGIRFHIINDLLFSSKFRKIRSSTVGSSKTYYMLITYKIHKIAGMQACIC